MGDGRAIRYPVGVGKAGKQWAGTSRIDGKYVQPAWSPPADVKRDNPRLPDVIAGGSPHNPMGVAAMTLAGGEYAIHGTNMPGSVGDFVSYGCIRMYNADVTDLFGRVCSARRWWFRAEVRSPISLESESFQSKPIGLSLLMARGSFSEKRFPIFGMLCPGPVRRAARLAARGGYA